MNVLSIGGSGFVSGTFTRIARDAGHTVHAVTRGQRTLPDGVQSIVADRKDHDAFARAIDDAGVAFDLIVDCVPYSLEDAEQDVSVFAGRGAQLVFISTDFVFDPTKRQYPQPADNPHYITEGYGGQKRLGELHLQSAGDKLPFTVIRPCHIYGPGSQLGCLPKHSRDADLIAKMKRGETLDLVGGGHFLQQPIFAEDLARLILSCHGNDKAIGKTYMAAGPDIIESRDYYRIIADALGVDVTFAETPVDRYLEANPQHAAYLCHRIYDIAPLHADNLAAPDTPITVGLRRHVQSLL